MRKLFVPAVAAAVLASSALAFAASAQHTNGTIKTVDMKAMSLVLDDGSTYVLSKKFKDPGLKAGEKVAVTWDTSGKDKVAEVVKILK
ncbi:DUF1344 domain-containing protein [Aminobacter sp. Piv2-1]|uniref:DUF1344 domain-containing protein n=1 Tax=Aminobacter sp. Piv2-1 TaxID=3031122 RepID=UPI0030B7AC45